MAEFSNCFHAIFVGGWQVDSPAFQCRVDCECLGNDGGRVREVVEAGHAGAEGTELGNNEEYLS